MTQNTLGTRLGVLGMTVYRWENGYASPQRRYWRGLETITGIPIATILAACQPRPDRQVA